MGAELFRLPPEDWAALRALLDEGLALPAPERERWLQALDPARAALKPHLARLLAHADAEPGTAERLLDTLAGVETGSFAPSPPPAGTVGPYRLLRPLGEGGMGSVWLAVRTDMLQGRQVALKLPHGAWRRAGLAERMAREREILATLEHPNIARLYDAGVGGDGQPWLALEYVEGERLDTHCRRRALPLRERLRLFLQVARAVAHAHAHLVVHRDLKPANILVTAGGEVKLLDFGIAKLAEAGVAAETELTREAGRAFTPDYASPEQILGQPLGTASDVYSLGVVLYELLADERPYRLERSTPAALAQAVAALVIEAPSQRAPATRRRALRGELDTIVARALKREPAERYATVAALADDIERHLDGRPVLAQPDSAGYRLRRFVRRHRLAVGAGSAVALALVAGIGVAGWQAQRARAEQQRAEEVALFIGSIFREANPFQQGSGKPLSGVDLLRLAKDRLQQSPPGDPATRVELHTLLGASLLALEDVPTAKAVLDQAVDDAARNLPADDIRAVRARLAQADAARAGEATGAAAASLDTLIAELRPRASAHPEAFVTALRLRADLHFRGGTAASSEPLFAEADAVATRHLAPDAPERLALLALQVRVLRMRAMAPQALQVSETALGLASRRYAAMERHPVLNEARYTHAYVLADNGRYAEAVALLRGAIADTEGLFGAESRRLAMRLGASSEVFAQAGHLKEAIANAERSRRLLLAQVPARSRVDAASAESVALAHNWARDGDGALPHWRHAEAVYREVFGDAHWVVQVTRRNMALALAWAGALEESRRTMAEALRAAPARAERDSHDMNAWMAGITERLAGRPAEALVLQARALASMDATFADSEWRAYALTERGLAQLAQADTAAARVSFEQALAIFRGRKLGLGCAHADALLGMARVALLEGRAAQALPELERVQRFWDELRPDSAWAGEAAHWRAQALAGAGRAQEAAAAREQARRLLGRSPFPVHRPLMAASPPK